MTIVAWGRPEPVKKPEDFQAILATDSDSLLTDDWDVKDKRVAQRGVRFQGRRSDMTAT